MTCKEFTTNLASLKDPSEISQEMQRHQTSCPQCARAYDNAVMLMQFINEEKTVKVSPFLKTRVAAKLEEPVITGWYARPAILTAVSVIVFIFGILSANILESPEKVNPMESIASDYYFQSDYSAQLEEIWFNANYYEE